MGKPFTPKLPPSSVPNFFTPRASVSITASHLISPHLTTPLTPPQVTYHLDKLRLPLLLIAGLLLQSLLSLALPPRWAVVPLLATLAATLLSHLLDRTSTSPVPPNVVPGRTAAQRPLSNGSFSDASADEQVVVFHIGAQFNHPLGFLCPGAKETGDRFDKLQADLAARRDEFGLLSVQGWSSTVDGSLSTLTTMYFKDVESLHRFAHEDMHRDTWEWFAAKRFPHIGVYHETFVVPKRGYESVFLNCKPMLMGNGASLARDEKTGEERWVNMLVSADTPALKTQYARMGRDKNGQIVD